MSDRGEVDAELLLQFRKWN